MKRLIVMGAAMMLVINLNSCSSDSSDDEVINKGVSVENVTPSKEVSDFFDREWTHLGDGSPESFFKNNNQNIYAMVNSEEEFCELYQGDNEIPYIDFNQYTLVVGKKKYYTSEGEKNPTHFEGQKLYQMEGKYVLDLSCRYNVPGVSFYSDRFICYWGLYPKLLPQDITVNIQYVD